MATAKETVESILKSLPDNATYEDIMYEIYVRRNIEKGLDDIQKGNVSSEEEMNMWLQKWLK
jgi:predicted transcriptional regulator